MQISFHRSTCLHRACGQWADWEAAAVFRSLDSQTSSFQVSRRSFHTGSLFIKHAWLKWAAASNPFSFCRRQKQMWQKHLCGKMFFWGGGVGCPSYFPLWLNLALTDSKQPVCVNIDFTHGAEGMFSRRSPKSTTTMRSTIKMTWMN